MESISKQAGLGGPRNGPHQVRDGTAPASEDTCSQHKDEAGGATWGAWAPPDPGPCRHGHLSIPPDDPDVIRYGIGAAALRYADLLGLPVLPLKPGKASPACENGFYDGTTDPAVITSPRWWGGNKAYGVGIRPDRHLVLDLDRKGGKDGAESLLAWLAEHGLALPVVPYATTPRNGIHLWMRLPDGATAQSRNGVLPGLDVRAAGVGYLAAWPTGIRLPRGMQQPGDPPPGRHDEPSYGTYEWHGCPCRAPVAPLELLDALSQLSGTGSGGEGGGGDGADPWTNPDIPTLLANGIPPGVRQRPVLRDVVWELVSQGKSDAEIKEVWDAIVAKTTMTRPSEPWTAEHFRRELRGAREKSPGMAGFGPEAAAAAFSWAQGTSATSGDAAVGPAADEPQGQPAPGRRPPRPGLDSLVSRALCMFGFARDTGGELFLLPADGMRAEPYIPRSFLTRDVVNLGHVMWRGMAQTWNAWVASLDKEEREKLGVTRVGLTPGDTVIRNAASHLEAIGMARGRKVTVGLRAVRVEDGTAIVIDLGDDTGNVVYVSAVGWRVTDPRDLPCDPPVFRRSIGYSALPRPVPGGNLDDLWSILRLGREDTRALAGGWLVAAYFADIPRPGIWLTGPPGAGKTTFGCGLARLVDGLEWLDGKLDRSDERNNIIRAVKCYVPSFDNMTGVTADQSDWICQLVTGHRDMFRRMRTNFDDVSMAYKRTFVATGLALPYGLAADALDRVIEAPADRITEDQRRSDEQIRRELDEARPRLLGTVLDHVSAVLARLPGIAAGQSGLSRMNGYSRILMAHDQAYGTGWLKAYLGSVKAARDDKATDEPVIAALLAWLQPGHFWTGTPGELLKQLSPCRPLDGWWPSNGRSLSVNLTKNDGVLVSQGLHVSRPPDRRQVSIRRDPQQAGP